MLRYRRSQRGLTCPACRSALIIAEVLEDRQGNCRERLLCADLPLAEDVQPAEED